MSVNPRKRPLDNESEDFIRLSPTSTANPVQSNQNYRSNKNWKNRRPKTPSVYGDNNLYSRVQQLLSTTQVMEEHSIVDHLQKKYPEYKRKKKSALKRSVSKTLELMNENLSSEDISEDSSEVIIDPKVQEDTNYLNNVMNDFYSKKDKPNKEANDSNLSNQRPKQKKNEQKSENDANRKADRNIDALLSKQISLKEKYLCEPKLTFEDFGGISNVIEDIKKLMFHLRHPVLYTTIGVDPPRGFLLHGPPGVGKSAIVEAIAHDLNIPLLRCGATELVAGISGESEGKIRELFNLAKSVKPCILFIDEIDSITQKRENAAKEMERRIVTQLLTSLDNLGTSDSDGVMVIGATNRADSIDAALRRAGRFDREISLGIPDRKARIDILKILCKNVKLTDNFDFEALAHKTPGYVGADLKSLIREAAITALERVLSIQQIDINSSFDSKNIKIEELTASLTIEMKDFDQAVKQVQPSSKREGFATVPDVTWDDIGALSDIRQELQLSILAPVKYVKDVKALGLSTSVGIMLCGPPGCGKTLLAKAIANESGINFISVKGPELLNMYVGESERAIRCVFNRARNSQPCVIFFDEMDALCPKRNDSEANYSSRVVNQLLTEMDGLESRNCFLLAATNRPDIIDPAILRPGRFDKILCVSFPAKSDRFEILKTLSKNGTKPPLSPDIDLKCLAEDERLEGMTGADLHSLLRESSLAALKDRISGELKSEDPIVVNKTHMEYALNKIKPSISEEQRRLYQKMYSNYRIKL